MKKYFLLVSGFWYYLSLHSKSQSKLLIFLMVLSAFTELASIGAIFPIITLLVAGESVDIFKIIGLQMNIPLLEAGLLQVFVIFYVVAALIAMATRLISLRLSTKLVAQISTEISGAVFLKTLSQPYIVHISRNSSQILDAITNKLGYVSSFSSSLFTLIGTITMFIFLVSGMLMINIGMTLIGLFIFGAFYVCVNIFFKSKLLAESALVSRETARVAKITQEALGSVRDIELDRSQKIFYEKYLDADISFRNSLGNIQFISLIPRYVVECMALIFFILIAYIFVLNGRKNDVLPIFGPLILITQKLIPAIQQAYASLINIKGGIFSLYEVLDLLHQPMPNKHHSILEKKIGFKSELLLDDIWFRYPESSAWSAEALNLKIPRGSCVGFIGKTGSGKSTLIDIVMGLLRPTKGRICVDGVEINDDNLSSWQACISHVPQSIYILDSSVLENIALGVPLKNINIELVRWAAHIAQIDEVIEGWPLRYDTQLGERGVRVSGGQLQRIGVARALYRKSQVLILDEATSALDQKIEDQLISAIRNTVDNDGLKKTILMVAHRLSTLRHCDYLVEVDCGKIIAIDSYQNVIKRKSV